MGLFSRKRDAQGLYLGDAPVSAPGVGGAAPGAYAGPQFQDHAEHAPSLAGSSYPAGPPAQQAAPQVHTLDPATAARIQQQLSGAGRKVSKLGCLLIAIPLIGALVGVGFAIYAAVGAATSAGDAVGGVTAERSGAAAPDGRHLGATSLGEPVSIRTDTAAYDITIFGAETQTGNGWGYDSPGSTAVLVVDAQITRTDTGGKPIEFTGWNWSVIGTDGTRVTGNIISHFEPSLDGPELVGGQTARGYVTFDTAATATSLTVSAGPAGPGLATWRITAATPQRVDGVVGQPTRAELSRPGFTVTIGQPRIVAAGDESARGRPSSGQYVVLPIEFAGAPGTVGHLGNVDSERFVFVPDGAPAMLPSHGGVDGSFSFVSIDAAAPEKGALAFDTAATAGRLELRNEADRAIIAWRIVAG